MAKVDVVNLKNEKVGSVELSDAVFGQKANGPLVLQVINAQLANRRQGTHANKTKGLVRGGGKKPFRQKGTGNARQGSSRSPLMPGGGSNFGPQPRDYRQNTPKSMIRGALRAVLSDKLAAKHLVIVDSFDLKSAKTKILAETLRKTFAVEKAVLMDSKNQNLRFASRNIPAVTYLPTESINAYDLVRHDWLFLTKESAQALAEKLA